MKRLMMWLCGLSFGSAASAAGLFPTTVRELDFTSYLGRWYEIASTKSFVQRGCVCTTADYLFPDDDYIQAINSCRRGSPEGRLVQIEGEVLTTRDPAKLKVSVGALKAVYPNYWVVDIADDYRYAVVSSPTRSPIWILSRTRTIDPADLRGIYARLRKDGFDVSKISATPQDGCSE